MIYQDKASYDSTPRGTGWRRLIGSPKLQIIFHKRATKYTSLLQKMTYKDKGSDPMSLRHPVPRHVPSTREIYIFIYTCLCVYFAIHLYAGSSACHAVRSHGRRTQQTFIFQYSQIYVYVYLLIYVYTESVCAPRNEGMDAVHSKCI